MIDRIVFFLTFPFVCLGMAFAAIGDAIEAGFQLYDRWMDE